MEIKDFLSLMWQRARVVIAGLILGTVLGFVVSRIQTPIYEATTDVLISRSRQQTNTDMLPLDENQLVSTNIRLAKSQAVLEAASSQIGSKIKADNIQVNVIPNTLIIQIKAQDQDPRQAAAIANTLVQVLIQQNENLVAGRYTAYESSLKLQIDQIQKQINELQTQISQISDASIAEQLTQVNLEIEQLNSQISSLEYEINGYPANLSDVQRASLSEKQAELIQFRSLLNLYQQIQTNLTFIGKPGQTGLALDDPRLSSLQSTLNLYQQLYLSLVNDLETVNLDRMQNTPNIEQINPAVPPKDPVRPLPLLYVLLGGVVGLFLSITTILMLDHFDESLKTTSQAEELLHLPVLGFVTDVHQVRYDLITSNNHSLKEAEAFRSLGASIEIACAKKNVRTLLVVNANPKGTKTTIAAHLAVVNAQHKKQVCLLDGDFGQPHLHTLFGMENEAGLADIIEKDADLKGVTRSVEAVAGVSLISSGIVTEGPLSWLNAEKWTALLAKLQKQADLVIVDAPSVEVADAQVLASKSDAVLLTIKLGETSAEAAKTALRRLQLAGAKVTGIVMYNSARYRTIHSPVFHWAGKNKKGGPRKVGSQLEDTTIPLS